MTLAIAWLNVSGENPSGWLNVLGDPHELENREAEDLGDLEVNDELQRVKVR